MLKVNEILKKVNQNSNRIIKFRREIHKNPELGFEEYQTSRMVAELLKKWGYEIKTNIGQTGVVGYLNSDKGNKTVALRADMDALPIKEENECSYRSSSEGKMHACGHDGHTAMLLGAAEILAEQRENLKGNIKVIFQPAEEVPPGGAKYMVEEGILKDVDVIFGLHINTQYDTGIIGINRGSAMASTDVFEVELIGRGGHPGLPHESVDPIAMLGKFINAVQYMVSRENDPVEPLVVSIGEVKGGSASNVIADKVKLSGTIRTQSSQVRERVKGKIKEILKYVTDVSGGSYKLNLIPGLPPLINDSDMVRFAKDILQKSTGINISEIKQLEKPSMGGEDFAYYLQQVPGAFLWVGARNKEKGFTYPMHHPKFNFDERALIIGTKVYIALALNFLIKK